MITSFVGVYFTRIVFTQTELCHPFGVPLRKLLLFYNHFIPSGLSMRKSPNFST